MRISSSRRPPSSTINHDNISKHLHPVLILLPRNLVSTSHTEGCAYANSFQVPTTPSPLSTYSPASTQHKLLAHLQSVLEAACYEFGKRTMPDTLQRHGWDCAEALELNRCVKELQHWSFLSVNPANKPPDELFRSIAEIRHTAVHRRRVSLHVVRQFFTDAETLLLLFGDDVRRREIAMLRQEVRMAFAKTKQNHRTFHSTVSKSLRVIATKRAHLRCVK